MRTERAEDSGESRRVGLTVVVIVVVDSSISAALVLVLVALLLSLLMCDTNGKRMTSLSELFEMCGGRREEGEKECRRYYKKQG